MRKYITHVNETVVETENPVTKEKKAFPISDAFRTNELIIWKSETSAPDSEQTVIPYRKDGIDSSVGMSIKQHDLLTHIAAIPSHERIYQQARES